MKTNYEIDRLPLDKIQQLQTGMIRETMQSAYDKSEYYRKLFDMHAVTPGSINTIEDLPKLPLTTREEVGRRNEEFWAISRDDTAELVSTSGTTGGPVYVPMTSGDLERLAYNEEKSFTCAGAVKSDLFLIDVTCDNLFIAGIAYYSGIIRLGASVVRVGPQNISRQFDLIRKLGPQGIVAVPSFIARMISTAREKGIDIKEMGIKKIVLIGDSVRNEDLTLNPLGRLIEEVFGNIFYTTYGITEGQVSFCECGQKRGLHSHPDLVFAEIVDDSGRPLLDGETGELVLTTLQIEGMPLVRYRTGDITYKISTPCQCGRNSVRIGPVLGRKNHRLKFKGVTLYPRTIENAMCEMTDVVNYQIEAYTGEDHTDKIVLRVGSERDDNQFRGMVADSLRAKARVSPEIMVLKPDEVAERLYANGSRKAIIFLDNRKKQV